MAVMTGTNRNRRRPETESAEEAERHTIQLFLEVLEPPGRTGWRGMSREDICARLSGVWGVGT